MAAVFQFLVEVVQQDVGSGEKRSALRRADCRLLQQFLRDSIWRAAACSGDDYGNPLHHVVGHPLIVPRLISRLGTPFVVGGPGARGAEGQVFLLAY